MSEPDGGEYEKGQGNQPDSGPWDLLRIADSLTEALRQLEFGPPVTHVYNPLEYAREPYEQYVTRFGKPPKEVVLMGMNPGPWGMAQTGIPFGEVRQVMDWLGIRGTVGRPESEHPKRPVTGYECPRSEVSGSRIWGWARETFGDADLFFSRFFIANYCPLLFLEESGRNRTPDRLPAQEREPLLRACDLALRRTVVYLRPSLVIGIGRFAEGRAKAALTGIDVRIGRVTHPSPANPAANRGWAELVSAELRQLGVRY
jgi:single-strand selective monofunctional uracil DNA glycosylase